MSGEWIDDVWVEDSNNSSDDNDVEWTYEDGVDHQEVRDRTGGEYEYSGGAG